MPSLPDGIVIFILALLLFGPKRLPVLARELGKWVGEFRRASNEFKMQMEDELRVSEQADRQKQIEAMQAAAPATPALPADKYEEPEHPHLPRAADVAEEPGAAAAAQPVMTPLTAPLPIAASGELKLMPPETGLPMARGMGTSASRNELAPLLSAIPSAEPAPYSADSEPAGEEHTAHA